ncbi:MAG: phosphoribosylformylglycinamidine cyclo-ligase [Candidatus Woesearchaeota archaeon]|nr:phosphoribosylformylglycinamidine cyclo-ligase [Candidatus Woesearchaeota archaeon]
MKALIVFGSSSDKPVYDRITANLAEAKMRVCSAHRTPALLERLIEMDDFDVIIAGAGMAAHLGGVCAALATKAVIGVPVKSTFDGLDALLAVSQMPPGISVMSVGIDCAENAASFVNENGGKTAINIVEQVQDEKVLKKCTKILDAFGAPYTKGDVKDDALNIVLLPLDGTPVPNAIHIPVHAGTTAADAQKLMPLMNTGVWVGVNRGENAALGALQFTNKYDEQIKRHRLQQRHKIYGENKGATTTYKDAGVDIDAGNASVDKMKAYVQDTFNEHVLADVGSFGGLYKFTGYENPVLVASSDGVGTKTKIAAMMKKFDTVGQDLVNHCANDILVQGAKPLFFLDYVAASTLKPDMIADVVKGLAAACKANGCALIGGETAEMPGVYCRGEFDVASAIVGAAEEGKLITGEAIKEGDTVLGLPSNGLHTNGYSLAIKVFLEDGGMMVDDEFEGTTIGDALLAVHKSYVQDVLPLIEKDLVHGMAHITGGGIVENVPRVLPKGLGVKLTEKWNVPPIFTKLQEMGNVPADEMYRTFNMGIGFVLITDKPEEITQHCPDAFPLGTVVQGEGVQL